MFCEFLHNILPPPAFMPEFHHICKLSIKVCDNRFEAFLAVAKAWRELEEYASQFVSESFTCNFIKLHNLFLAIFQSFDMCNGFRGFNAENKAIRRFFIPGFQAFQCWKSVKSRVKLVSIEIPAIIFKPLFSGHSFRKKKWLPRCCGIARASNMYNWLFHE